MSLGRPVLEFKSEPATAQKVLAGQPQLAARLAGIRAEISALTSAPPVFGSVEPHRRRRDEDILRAFAADVHARLAKASAGQ
jgi:hypothetical protein